jgi:hypothetical protein
MCGPDELGAAQRPSAVKDFQHVLAGTVEQFDQGDHLRGAGAPRAQLRPMMARSKHGRLHGCWGRGCTADARKRRHRKKERKRQVTGVVKQEKTLVARPSGTAFDHGLTNG